MLFSTHRYGLPGKCWYLAFEPDGEPVKGSLGDKRRLRELARARKRLHKTIDSLRTPNADGIVPSVLLFGYGHGAIVAIDAAMSCPKVGEIKGVVAVSGGCVLPEVHHGSIGKDQGATCSLPRRAGWHPVTCMSTPVLVHHGSADKVLPAEQVAKTCDALQRVGVQIKFAQFPRGSELPRSECEMRCIFEFLSPLLNMPSRLDDLAQEPGSTLIDVTGTDLAAEVRTDNL